jgi:RNA polymerase sigma-70 factor (ECF subfamily)
MWTMEPLRGNDSGDDADLLGRAMAGDRAALDEIFDRHRDRLRRMVRLRLSHGLHGLINTSDVITDAFQEAARRFDEYRRDLRLPLSLWLRLVLWERLAVLHHWHLSVKKRDAEIEVPLYPRPLPAAIPAALAEQLLDRITSPTEAVVWAKRFHNVEAALTWLDPIDREALAMQHFEQLTCADAGQVLGIDEAEAAKRYRRALKQLKKALPGMTGLAGP